MTTAHSPTAAITIAVQKTRRHAPREQSFVGVQHIIAAAIQGAYIDYSDWALSGSVRPDRICTKVSGEDTISDYRACTQPNEVASEEYRIVRGELLDAQNWTWRNTTVRVLTLFGSMASGYSFSIKETGFIKGISAFGGIVVPGFATFWPDETVSQLNRISDFGFQTNKVISKQGSDIIVCFFPIDRFLTESYRKLFVKNPSVFFSPLEALVEFHFFEVLADGCVQSNLALRASVLDYR